MTVPARVHIGTSGWHYSHWKGPFYPERLPTRQMLEFYLQHFDTVELNSTFYRLPKSKVLREWRQAAPARFLFAVKGSRFITHNKKLKDPKGPLHQFLPRVEVLRRKLGPILFQTPPHWRVNLERLETFLEALPRRHRYAFEFREPSWHSKDVYDLLRRHRAAFCVFDIGGFHSPIQVTADFTYIRLHGPAKKYQGSYSSSELAAWARRIRSWKRRLKDIYIYFDNDQAAYAAHNALELACLVSRRRCGGKKPSRPAARHREAA